MVPHHLSVSTRGREFIIPHFRVSEFAQSNYDELVLDPVALMALNNFRQLYGDRVIITSGFRTAEHNARIGGVPTSLHLRGKAFDLRVRDGVDPRVGQLLTLAGFNEVIGYPDGHWHAGMEH